jgi:hypothetical protein
MVGVHQVIGLIFGLACSPTLARREKAGRRAERKKYPSQFMY